MTTENTHEPRFAFCPSCGREQRGAPPGPQRRYLVAAQHGGKSDLAGTGDVGRDHHSGPGALMGEVDEPLPAVTYADCLAAAEVCRRVPCAPGYLVMPIADFILPPAMVCVVPANSPFGRAYSGAWLPSKSIH